MDSPVSKVIEVFNQQVRTSRDALTLELQTVRKDVALAEQELAELSRVYTSDSVRLNVGTRKLENTQRQIATTQRIIDKLKRKSDAANVLAEEILDACDTFTNTVKKPRNAQ